MISLRRAIVLAPVLVAALSGMSVQAAAQDADSLRQQFRLPAPPTFEVSARGTWVAPGITIGTPSAFGADYGDAFVGVGYQRGTRWSSSNNDGGVVAGFGLGDARDLVGLELAATSFGTFRSCCRGGLHVKVHRLLPANSSVAVGWENAVTWGQMLGEELATDAGSSLYGVVSKVFRLQPSSVDPLSALTVSVGAGTGRFRTEDQIFDDEETLNPFVSASLRVVEPLSVIANWTGQDLVAGVSLVPFRGVPLFITPAVMDLTTDPRFILGLAYGFDYSNIF